jgi:hypothetical protein
MRLTISLQKTWPIDFLFKATVLIDNSLIDVRLQIKIFEYALHERIGCSSFYVYFYSRYKQRLHEY